MQNNITENIVLHDWLSFTSKQHTPEELITRLGLAHVPWTDTKGARGYMDRKYFNSISIHYNGREDMGVWVEMSGQGCRAFEELTTLPNKWDDLFSFIHACNLHITRLDVAFDDHTGLLDINRIMEDTREGRFVSRMNYWECIESSKGSTVQIGSPQSKVLVRIYDKAAERGFPDQHWIRIELQMRDGRAEEFSKIPLSVGEAFAGVLLNYLRYVEPDETDSNKARWAMTEYWANLLAGAERIKIYSNPGTEYNEERCRHYVFEMAGNAVDALLQMYGEQDFMTLLHNRQAKPNPKYELIVKAHHARQEAWAKKVRSFFTVEEVNETDLS